jgi:hypothetical protein
MKVEKKRSRETERGAGCQSLAKESIKERVGEGSEDGQVGVPCEAHHHAKKG